MEHLKAAFLGAFGHKDTSLWSRERQLYNMHQGPEQSSLQFATQVRNAADSLKLADDQLLRVITGGLRPPIRSFVLQQKPQNLAAMLEAAATAENTAPQDLSLIMDIVMSKLEEIKAQMDSRTPQAREIRTPSPGQPEGSDSNRPPQQPQPQPRFQDSHPNTGALGSPPRRTIYRGPPTTSSGPCQLTEPEDQWSTGYIPARGTGLLYLW